MAKKARVLGDQEILTKVMDKARESVGWYDSRLSLERERVLRYYNGELPRRQHEGGSSYVSTDVYDSVEMMKAQILEAFSGGDEIAQFDPDQDMGAEDCRVATKYASYIIFRQNEGFSLFSDVIQDGLIARCGVAQVWWDEKYDYAEETFDQLPHFAAMGLASQPDVDEFDGTLDEQTGNYSGRLVRKTDRSQVSMEAVPPEEFLITPRAIDIESAAYKGRRTLKTKDELKKHGFDPKKVDKITYDDGKGLELAPEVLARNRPIETAQAVNNPIQPEMEQVMYYESYVRMVIDKDKGARLYKICHAGSELLDYEEVDRAPFLAYVPLPIPHLFYGNNFAGRVIPFQNARTVLVRAVLDHTAISVNPRYQVVKGGLLNPRELIENRLGGIVNVQRPDTVTPLPQNNLNPFVFEVLGLMKDDKEQSTGISSLSQGLNKDAISKQNSQGLVDQLVSLSGQREKICARHFAYNFFVPLMQEVIRLSILNEKKEKIVEVAGNFMKVNPQLWTERRTATVSMHLGYGEKDMAVAKHTQAYKMLAEDPVLQNAFGLQQRIDLANDTLKLAGIHKSYLDPNAQPPQPDPLKVQENQTKDKTATAALMTAQAANTKATATAQYEQAKIAVDSHKVMIDGMEKDRANDRHDLEAVARVDIARREMKLEETLRPKELTASLNPRA